MAKNAVAQGLNTGIALAFTITSARLLLVADYGELRYVMTLLPLFMIVSLPGYDTLILRTTNLRAPVPLGRIFRTRVLAGLAGAAILLAITFFWHTRVGKTLAFFLLCAAVFLPLFETATGFRPYLMGRGLRKQSLDLVIETRLTILLLFGLACLILYAADLNRLLLFPAYLLATIVPTLWAFARVALRRQGLRTKERHKTGKLDFLPAVAATLASFFFTLGFSSDRLWVHHLLGPESLAMYALLVMTPQELARLMEAMIPLYYRKLFFSKTEIGTPQIALLGAFLCLCVTAYILLFYYLSTMVFGSAYHYDLLTVAISGLMILSQSFEFMHNHKIMALFGAKALLAYSLTNLIITGGVTVPLGLYLGKLDGLLLAMILKQLACPSIFLFLYRRFAHRASETFYVRA